MKRVLISGTLLLAAAAFIFLSTGASKGTAQGIYKIQFQNAFGLVTGADFKVAGVPAGTIKSIDLDQKTLNAVVTIQVTRNGFGQFHQDASCQSRPESLIGEYFVDCNPGTSGPVLKGGSTIPVSHTQSTIPADLLQDVMRLPYRQRFTLIVNELGAAAAARSGDIQAALHRAVPALDETDNLLNLLANDHQTLRPRAVSRYAVTPHARPHDRMVRTTSVQPTSADAALRTCSASPTATPPASIGTTRLASAPPATTSKTMFGMVLAAV